MPTKVATLYNGLTWDENPVKASQELPFKQTHVTMERKYVSKDMEGWAIASYIMTYHPDDSGNATFHGQQVFTGTLLGKKGSFTCATAGTYTKGVVEATWTIVPESATEELKGIKGDGTYEVKTMTMSDIAGELNVSFD